MREIILDTETTGFNSRGDDRIIEIACLEIIDKRSTGRTFQTYLNPRRDVPLAATKVHNIKTDFLKDKPFFEDMAKPFLDFIEDSPLVIHNAPFDMGFLNAELGRFSYPLIPQTKAICTLSMARQKFPGANNTLDGLCKRYKIDLTNREYHGALIDCELLANVYVELLGGRQKLFSFGASAASTTSKGTTVKSLREPIAARDFPLSDDEKKDHDNFLKDIKDPLWDKIA